MKKLNEFLQSYWELTDPSEQLKLVCTDCVRFPDKIIKEYIIPDHYFLYTEWNYLCKFLNYEITRIHKYLELNDKIGNYFRGMIRNLFIVPGKWNRWVDIKNFLETYRKRGIKSSKAEREFLMLFGPAVILSEWKSFDYIPYIDDEDLYCEGDIDPEDKIRVWEKRKKY